MPTYKIFRYKNGKPPFLCYAEGIGILLGTDGIGILAVRKELIDMLMLLNGCANETAELTEKTLTSNTNAKTKMFCLMHHQLEKTHKSNNILRRRNVYVGVNITLA